MSKDVSDLSINNLFHENPPCGLFAVHMTYPVLRFLPRIGGAGFRTLSRLNHTRSLHNEKVRAMWDKSLLSSFLALA